MSKNSSPLKVKFLCKTRPEIWTRLLPQNSAIVNGCEFIFNKDAQQYDWLVVYDDMPPAVNERFSIRKEPLSCHEDNTLLVTIEPPSVKYYGQRYTQQFGHILTSQPESSLPHPNRIYSQAGLYWFYGVGEDHHLSLEAIKAKTVFDKTGQVSLVWSNKKQRHTTLFQRYKFYQRLKQELPGLDIFGAGHKPLDDKAAALDNYRYHITIENYQGLHHWTEKIADVFLGHCLPLYYGCPNLDEYFPSQSYIAIDIFDIPNAIHTIETAIKDNAYEQRKHFITDARRRVIERFNLFQMLSEIINQRHNPQLVKQSKTIYSRRAANQGNILHALSFQSKKQMTRCYFFFNGIAKGLIHG